MDSLWNLLPREPIRSVCFTGHRQIKLSDGDRVRLRETLEVLIKDGAADFYAGGAQGWDTVCARTVLALRAKYPEIRLHLVLPCPIRDFTRQWELGPAALLYSVAERADDVETLAPEYFPGCMKKRNLRLVEAADCCVCWYDSTRRASGTGQTVRFAEQKGIKVINLLEEQQ